METKTKTAAIKPRTTVCRYCGSFTTTDTENRRGGRTIVETHAAAQCVEGDEPSYRMGGPA